MTVAIRLDLPVRRPFAAAALSAALRAHAVPLLESVSDSVHRRVVAGPSGPALVEVDLGAPGDLPATLHLSSPEDADAVVATVRRWLDLDLDPRPVDALLATDPLLDPLVTARPGIRVVGAVDRADCALSTILGQQVSLAAARTLQTRYVASYGRPVELPGGEWSLPPRPVDVAATDPDELRATLRLTGARARALHTLAGALADGLALDPTEPGRTRAALLALPGIGPWTVDYLSVRALHDPDAFTPGDAVLRRALGGVPADEAERRSQAWRPWRAYALTHLWTATAY